jgi:hypothetical protein
MSDYTPIDCNLYDRYEAWATLRTPLIIEHRSRHHLERPDHRPAERSGC